MSGQDTRGDCIHQSRIELVVCQWEIDFNNNNNIVIYSQEPRQPMDQAVQFDKRRVAKGKSMNCR